MAHPFFDVVAYPFSRDEAKEFFRVLPLAEKNTARIDLIYTQSGSNLPPLTLPAAADLVWREVLINLTRFGFLRALCNQLKAAYPQPEMVNAIIAIEMAKPAVDKKVISDDIFVLDLEEQRPVISQITSDNSAAKIVLVRGAPDSGKSHCHHVFESIGEEKEASVVYLYEGMGDVQATIEYIFSSLGIGAKDVPPRLTSEEAWYRAVCTELKRIVTAQNKKLWIAMDDLGYIETKDENGIVKKDVNGNVEKGPMIDSCIRGFFQQFGFYMSDRSFAKFFRLMMINYEEPTAPTNWKAGTWLEITTDEKTIQQPHVEAFLTDWKGTKKVPMIEQDIKTMAAEVIATADNPPPVMAKLSRLQRIHDTLKFKLDEVLRKQPHDN